MNITSRQLKGFLLTARHQSFSRAAEQLFITQSGMSVLIRELEEQLGFRLFERTTRKVTLTPFGTRFLPIADRSLLELEAAARSIGRSASDADRHLAIGASPLIAGKLLPAAIADYRKWDATLQVVLHDGDRSRLVPMVSSGALHFALGCFFQPTPGLRLIPLHQFFLMAVEPEADALRFARPMRWDDLVERRLIASPADSALGQLIERQLARVGRRRPLEMTFNFFETQIAMVEAVGGTALIPSFAVPACIGHKVRIHPLNDPPIPVELLQVVSRARKLPPGAEGFTAFLKRYLADWVNRAVPPAQRAA
jgi:DNA-binding transcriptional LysR family regulator